MKDQRSAQLDIVLPTLEELVTSTVGPADDGLLAKVVTVASLEPSARHIVVPGPASTTTGDDPPTLTTTFGDSLESLVERSFERPLSDEDIANWAEGAAQRTGVRTDVETWARTVRRRCERDLLADLVERSPTWESDAPLSVATVTAAIAAHLGDDRSVNLVVEAGRLGDEPVDRHLRSGAVLEVGAGTLPNTVEGLLVRPDRATIHRAFGLTFGFVAEAGGIVLLLRERSLLKLDDEGRPPAPVGVALRRRSLPPPAPQRARAAKASPTVKRPS